MAAVPLALLLIGILVVLVAATPGAFSFNNWPDAPSAALSEREVVVDVPVETGPTQRADARREPAIERDGTALVAEAPRRKPVERPQAPVAAPSAPQAVADATQPEPHAETDSGTTLPVSQEAEPEEPSPAPLPEPALPAIPEVPAKELPEQPDEPEDSLPEWDDDRAAHPRRSRDDQE